MICIVDYGMGNLGSILNMLRHLGHDAVISAELSEIESAEKLILPGVGAFDNGMRRLEETGIKAVLDERVKEGATPVLGICLGMQLLLDGSEEGSLPGLSWVPGRAVRFDFSGSDKPSTVPHMGWNQVKVRRVHPILEGVDDEFRFYFVHSYRVVPTGKGQVLTTTSYGGIEFCSAVFAGPVIGVQFHPEKSHRYGMQLLDNFAKKV